MLVLLRSWVDIRQYFVKSFVEEFLDEWRRENHVHVVLSL